MSSFSTPAPFCCIKSHAEMAEKSQRLRFYVDWCPCTYEILFHIVSLNMDLCKSQNILKWWIIKVKHPLLDI